MALNVGIRGERQMLKRMAVAGAVVALTIAAATLFNWAWAADGPAATPLSSKPVEKDGLQITAMFWSNQSLHLPPILCSCAHATHCWCVNVANVARPAKRGACHVVKSLIRGDDIVRENSPPSFIALGRARYSFVAEKKLAEPWKRETIKE